MINFRDRPPITNQYPNGPSPQKWRLSYGFPCSSLLSMYKTCNHRTVTHSNKNEHFENNAK